MNRVIFINSLEQFEQEVSPPAVVRLNLTENRTSQSVGDGMVLPSLHVHMSLQGVNDQEEIIWLHWSRALEMAPGGGGFWREKDKQFYDQLLDLRETVETYLTRRNYDVRAGQFGLPKDIEPVNGQFECWKWEDGRIHSVG